MIKGAFTAAAVQVAPVLPFDKEKTVDKVCEATAEAADNGAKLVVFRSASFRCIPTGRSTCRTRPAGR